MVMVVVVVVVSVVVVVVVVVPVAVRSSSRSSSSIRSRPSLGVSCKGVGWGRRFESFGWVSLVGLQFIKLGVGSLYG